MKRMICTVSMLALLMTWTVSAFGASAKCEIVSVSDGKMIVDCGKNTEKFKEGTKIKIKTVRQKQIEGC